MMVDFTCTVYIYYMYVLQTKTTKRAVKIEVGSKVYIVQGES